MYIINIYHEKKKKELEQLLEDWENVQLEIEMVNS